MKIDFLQLVSGFQIDREITLTCGKILKDLEKKHQGDLILPAIPDSAPPESPRAIFKTKDAFLSVALNRFELNVRPPSHIIANYSASLDYLKKRSEQFMANLCKNINGYEWTGLVAKLEFPNIKPLKNGSVAAVPVFDTLVNYERKNRTLSNFQLAFGFTEGTYNKSFNISGYEARDISVNVPAVSKYREMFFDVSNFPIKETGIQIVFDVNNKPKGGKKFWAKDVNALVNFHKKHQTTILSELGLEEVIHDQQ